MVPVTDIRVLYLVLTARCNLACGYCFQNDKNRRRMEWETAQAAVDLLLASRQERLELVFFGGEPFLEFPLVRRTVDYVRERVPENKELRFAVITNGTLLGPEALDFLVDHEIDTQLSFDGIPASQEVRGRGTFVVLDRLLDRMRRDHPGFLRRGLTVSVTITPQTVPNLSASFRYFLNKGVKRVAISPVYTHAPGWDDGSYRSLEAEFAALLEESLEHYERSGEVPFLGFRSGDADDPHRPKGRTMCGVMRGETPVVDVDGSVHGCATFAGSYQTYPSAFLADRVAAMAMGDLRDPAFAERYRAFPEAARGTGLFHNKQRKHSRYGRCGSCRFLADCSVCPTSIGHIPGNRDPDRVPDFLCAYNLIALAAREQFRSLRKTRRPAASAFDREGRPSWQTLR